MKVVIIGGVAGGASAAARLRRLDEKAEIIIFERSGYVSYANCGLPYYIGGVITDRENLTLKTPESFMERFRVDVRVLHEVTDIHADKKTVSVKNLTTGEVFEETYDKLILSPGAKPVKPDVPGIDNKKIFTLRTVEDTLKIREFVEYRKPKTAAVIGGGFIGIEMAENLSQMGIHVTVIQRPKQLMNMFDSDMASFIHAKIRENGIEIMLGADVTGFKDIENYLCCTCRPAGISGNADPSIIPDTKKIAIEIKDRKSVTADMVIMAVGVTPDSELAKRAGLKLGIKNSIAVNEHMQTEDPDIYAVGDAVQVKNSVSGMDAVISLAGPANKQGRIAADNICGINSVYNGSQGSNVIKIFDMTAASTGLTEKTAKAAGLNCESIVISPQSHADYYPGAKALTMKVVFEKETFRLLGAQIVGSEGVDKRIDVLATAVSLGISGDRLKELDLAYAPPYASAKDPVNMAGFVIENIKNGLMKQFFYDDVDELIMCKTGENKTGENETRENKIDGESIILLDTRTEKEYARGHADGFVNIPLDSLRERLFELDKDKKVYCMCQSGLRSYIACRILMENGFDAYNFAGGYRFYDAVSKDRLQNENTYPCGMEK